MEIVWDLKFKHIVVGINIQVATVANGLNQFSRLKRSFTMVVVTDLHSNLILMNVCYSSLKKLSSFFVHQIFIATQLEQ